MPDLLHRSLVVSLRNGDAWERNVMAAECYTCWIHMFHHTWGFMSRQESVFVATEVAWKKCMLFTGECRNDVYNILCSGLDEVVLLARNR